MEVLAIITIPDYLDPGFVDSSLEHKGWKRGEEYQIVGRTMLVHHWEVVLDSVQLWY